MIRKEGPRNWVKNRYPDARCVELDLRSPKKVIYVVHLSNKEEDQNYTEGNNGTQAWNRAYDKLVREGKI